MVPDVSSRTHAAEPMAILMHTPAKHGFNPITCDLPTDLSQITVDTECQEITVKAKDQNTTDFMRTHYVVKNNILFRSVPDSKGGQRFQIVVPTSLKEAFLTYAHDRPLSGHLGKLKTLRLLEFAYWPSIRTDVWQHCKQCGTCQQNKPTTLKPAGGLQSVPIVDPGYMLGMDIMEPFPWSIRQK